MQFKKSPGRASFTQQARDAALAVRRTNVLNREHITAPKVFVVRQTSFPDPFAWEIRRFGGVVLLRSEGLFPSMAFARAAGGEVLARMPSP